jgi:hypothetical protein
VSEHDDQTTTRQSGVLRPLRRRLGIGVIRDPDQNDAPTETGRDVADSDQTGQDL